jgi:DNA-binding NarL/FixJ family response regulator
VLITDYQMPDLDGIELSTHIRRLYPQTAIVMISSYHHTDTLREWAACTSIQSILPKPVNPKKLCEIISVIRDRALLVPQEKNGRVDR